MGYAFVEFATKADAEKVIKQLQNVNGDGHALQLKLSQRGGGPDGAAAGDSKGSSKVRCLFKLFVTMRLAVADDLPLFAAEIC